MKNLRETHVTSRNIIVESYVFSGSSRTGETRNLFKETLYVNDKTNLTGTVLECLVADSLAGLDGRG